MNVRNIPLKTLILTFGEEVDLMSAKVIWLGSNLGLPT